MLKRMDQETFNKFLEDYTKKRSSPISYTLRDGQLMMNTLYDHNPEMYLAVTGTRFDPFYKDERIGEFLTFISESGSYEGDKISDNFISGIGFCYIPESGDSIYLRKHFVDIAKGNEKTAEIIFGLCEWQHPETIFEEGVREGEWDINGNILSQ